jgi:hypothetical protein
MYNLIYTLIIFGVQSSREIISGGKRTKIRLNTAGINERKERKKKSNKKPCKARL